MSRKNRFPFSPQSAQAVQAILACPEVASQGTGEGKAEPVPVLAAEAEGIPDGAMMAPVPGTMGFKHFGRAPVKAGKVRAAGFDPARLLAGGWLTLSS